jgi:hypothetical protein
MGNVKALLARARRLERPPELLREYREGVSATFTDAMAQGRMCPTDGAMVLRSVLRWIDEGLVRPI